MERLGLAEFLTALRGELAESQKRAEDDPLKLAVGTVELSLDVAYTLEGSGSAEAKLKPKFWVIDFGEVGVSSSVRSERMRTQHLKMVLTPRVESAAGARSLDVGGKVEPREDLGEQYTEPPPVEQPSR